MNWKPEFEHLVIRLKLPRICKQGLLPLLITALMLACPPIAPARAAGPSQQAEAQGQAAMHSQTEAPKPNTPQQNMPGKSILLKMPDAGVSQIVDLEGVSSVKLTFSLHFAKIEIENNCLAITAPDGSGGKLFLKNYRRQRIEVTLSSGAKLDMLSHLEYLADAPFKTLWLPGPDYAKVWPEKVVTVNLPAPGEKKIVELTGVARVAFTFDASALVWDLQGKDIVLLYTKDEAIVLKNFCEQRIDLQLMDGSIVDGTDIFLRLFDVDFPTSFACRQCW